MSSAASRRLAAVIAANERWARVPDRRAATAKARANSPTSLAYFERKVDPDNKLPEAQRKAMAVNARAAFYARLARIGVEARARKAAS